MKNYHDNTDTYKESLIKFIQSERVKNVSFWLIEDKWFKKRFGTLENTFMRLRS